MNQNMDRSIKVGLVLNGGVSYSIWMGGVTQEIDRARMSGCTHTAPASIPWQNIMRVVGMDLKVDVIAGTSAGGLNGAALATAIASGSALPTSIRELWLNKASLTGTTLLSEPATSPNNLSTRRNSILNGDYFFEQIRTLLEQVHKSGSTSKPTDSGEDVHLSITTTRLDPAPPDVTSGGPKNMLGVADHSQLYEFERKLVSRLRDEEFVDEIVTSDFLETGIDDIAGACRASASFPFAFASWQLSPKGPHHLDGGLLDNSPFDPVLKAIESHPRLDIGSRWIIYVTPEGGTAPLSPPDGWLKLPFTLFKLLRESDLASDQQSLKNFQRASSLGHIQPQQLILPRHDSPTTETLQSAALGLLPLYRVTRAREYAANYGGSANDFSIPLTNWLPGDVTPLRNTDAGDSWQWGNAVSRRIAMWISRDSRDPDSPLPNSFLKSIAMVERRLIALHRITVDCIRAESPAPLLTSPHSDLVYAELNALVTEWAGFRGLNTPEAWTRILATEVITRAVSWARQDPFPPFSLHTITPAREKLTANKLYAGHFANFGSFLAPSFRQHDWTWGRVDGAAALAQALLAKVKPDVLPEDLKIEMIDDLLAEICRLEGTTMSSLTAQGIAVSNKTTRQVTRAAITEGELDVKKLRNVVVEYLMSDPSIERISRGRIQRSAISSFLKVAWGGAFGHFLKDTPKSKLGSQPPNLGDS